MVDLYNEGVSLDFIDEVGGSLKPGKVAVVSEVDEMWVVPVETELGKLGATTFRRYTGDIVDEQLTREAEETKADLEQLRKEMSEAVGSAKATVQARIEADERKLDALDARIEAQSEKQTAQFKQRMAKLQEQLKSANDRRKSEIEARIVELKASNETRRVKLQKARALTQQAAQATKEAIFA
jgi:DNA repair exonuclease SbcCD ATPase subunit